MTRFGMAVVVMLLLAAGRGNADGCPAQFNEACCSSVPACGSGLACNPVGVCLFAVGEECDNSTQCATGVCEFRPGVPDGTCGQPAKAPAVSARTAMLMGASLLLFGLWSVRRVASRQAA